MKKNTSLSAQPELLPDNDLDGKRADPRVDLFTQAFVSIPPLSTKVFRVSEVSRGGMFLSYNDASTTFNEIEHAGIEKGGPVEVAFAILLQEKRHRISVRAKIARITRRGLGVEFLTRNPPQLASLRELFPEVKSEAHAAVASQQPAAHTMQKKVIQKLLDSPDWKTWEVVDN